MASRSLNKVMLIGNAGADPEVRTTSGGGRVANLSLATSRTWNGPSGDRQEKTEWHKCVVWNSKVSQLADVVEKYVRKGDRVYVEGRIEYRQYQDKDGQTRYVTEVNVRDLLLLSPRGAASDAEGATAGGSGAARTGRPERPRSGTTAKGAGGTNGGSGGGAGGGGGGTSNEEFEDIPGALADEDDDLPF